ncbi:type I phosphomannose isomerase catalytic subunit [Hathewaya limosa]|uniref:Mannose-6-phosphate isomerase n=1 Tax=Hathewaya limosa TaxID=1536 RepID=A0ABU0JMQ4_HATLI|nr:type I phosphomannose isomerase catalytic subunit [Hathewaya limosa]MDQ0478355.1 mannose-6-phosphate isomerase [Hathewaya limosa]
MKQNIFKLSAVYKEKPWGYERWNLCCHNEGECIIENGIFKGKTLWSYLEYKPFPLLIKTIKAEKKLSIQVHPDDQYAKVVEHDRGKNECWYILSANKDAFLYCGLKHEISEQELNQILYNGKIEKYLNKVFVKPGEFIYIPSGVIHAIGGGVKLLEIQQNSNITYRIYDYNRGRELHVKKASDVIRLEKNLDINKLKRLEVFNSEDFIIKKVLLEDKMETFNRDKFEIIYIVSGKGIIKDLYGYNEDIELIDGDTIYIDKNTYYSIKGHLEYICVIF